MDWLAEVVQAADSGWAITAIFLLGIYVLLWKFGGEVLQLVRDINTTAHHANKTAVANKKQVEDIATSIVTNHGSKNLGDAVDRITEWMLSHMAETREANEKLTALSDRLEEHIGDSRKDD